MNGNDRHPLYYFLKHCPFTLFKRLLLFGQIAAVHAIQATAINKIIFHVLVLIYLLQIVIFFMNVFLIFCKDHIRQRHA